MHRTSTARRVTYPPGEEGEEVSVGVNDNSDDEENEDDRERR